MSRLDQIGIYPIKSCSGIYPSKAEAQMRGFKLDRRWMLIEVNGKFLSQRTTPQLGQFQIEILDDQLAVHFQGVPSLSIGLNDSSGDEVETLIWNDTVLSHTVSPQADEWFSKIIGRSVSLVHMNLDVTRPLIKTTLPQERFFEVSFADGYPYLLTNEASLDDLNGRLVQPIGMDRFRPNLTVSGFEPFAEDHWKRIRIGNVEFMVVKPCARCQITTIDQKTGLSSKEPLKTLATYRKQSGKVMFGMNLVALSHGMVSVDDSISILE